MKRQFTGCRFSVEKYIKKCLLFIQSCGNMISVRYEYLIVRVAQLDRASDYGSEGREFESSRARYRLCLDLWTEKRFKQGM